MVIGLIEVTSVILISIWIGSRLPFIDLKYREMIIAGWLIINIIMAYYSL